MLRAVLDANVVASALIRPEGTCGLILEHVARRDGVRVVVSSAILDEYRGSLAYPKVQRYLGPPPEEVGVWVDALALLSDVVPGERVVTAVDADPDDDKYLAAALEGAAPFVVSGDRHLLGVGSYEGVRVVTPREFLDLLGPADQLPQGE